MNTAQIIYQQLGGNKFTVMTGSKNYVSDGDALNYGLAVEAKTECREVFENCLTMQIRLKKC